MQYVIHCVQGSTGLSLKATAGLRLLPGSKAQDILEAVRTYLQTFPFQVKAGAQPPLNVGRCLWACASHSMQQ
jgi:hypothetical protein